MKVLAITACLLALGCSSESNKKCEAYAKMEVKCGGYPANQHKATHKLAAGFCEKALDGDDMLNLKPEIDCAQKHKSCEQYSACQEGESN